MFFRIIVQPVRVLLVATNNRDWMKMLKPMDPPPVMVAKSMLERRGDTAALTRLQTTEA